jgi:serine/threonine protein kinase
MNDSRVTNWGQIAPLLDELLDLDEAARASRLADLRNQNPRLADSVAQLLAQEAAMVRDGFLDGTALGEAPDATLTGQVIGAYTIDRPLGEGGMGAVWLAHRSDGQYEGNVAIKLLSWARLGPGSVGRFRREGSVLAKLAHPNIARLLDAGVTEAGQPYLVLEYVEGEPIDRWCDARNLSVTDRVKLFLDVLAAIAHAHGKLILHRDLKPSNILVSTDGQAKLLDFGIAKLLDDAPTEAMRTQLTQLAGRAFTPEYAAPEQVDGGDVSTATDVYALGVLLYVLLTSQHPTSRTARTPVEVMRAVIDTVPARPSDVVSSVARTTPGTAVPELKELALALRGDLDNILAVALRKRPAERYQTAETFAADLRRYLNHEPVSARPDSFAYRAGKFIVRNRLGVGVAGVVLVTIVGAAGVALWQAREATRQRDRALTLVARNEAVIDFVSTMLVDVAPTDQPILIADLLERSRAELAAADADPEHQAAILGLLSTYFLTVGNSAKGKELLDQSLALVGTSSDSTLRAALICDRAYALSLGGEPAVAKREIEAGLALTHGDAATDIRCLQKRAFMAQNENDPATALEYATRAQARAKELPFKSAEVEASLLADIAYAHYLAGSVADADKFYVESLAKFAAIGRGEASTTISIRNNLGIERLSAGDTLRALDTFDEALRVARARSIDGQVPPYLLSNRATTLATLARYDEASAELERAIAVAKQSGNAQSLANSQAVQLGISISKGELANAEASLKPLLAQVGTTISAESTPASNIRVQQARLALATGDLAQAEQLFSQVLAFFDGRGMAIAPVVRSLNYRSDAYLREGKLAEAAHDAERAVGVAKKLQGGKQYSSLTGQSLLSLARVRAGEGKNDEAKRLAREAQLNLSDTLGSQHPDTLAAAELFKVGR